MQYIKNSVFLYLTPRQRSMLTGYLRSFAKKHSDLSANELLDEYIEEENYYQNVGNPHFEFALENFENEEFLSDIIKYFKYIFWEMAQKEAQKPLIEKQKAYEKKLRERANDFKMSKLKPTKKQLWYYEKITKAHNITPKDTKDATRLDLKNWITEIIEPKQEDIEDDV